MTDQPESDVDDLPEQMQVRREKRARLLESGREAYPIAVERTHTVKEIRETYDPLLESGEIEPDTMTGQIVSIVGRVIFLRNTGKLCFVRLREGDGSELQVMLSLASVGEDALADFKALVDLGDLLAVTGEVITSRRGELSVQASSWQIAAKTLRPLPNEHKPLSDEARIRLRYVDMMIRPEARDMVRTKAAVLRSLRSTLDAQGYLEVETPILQLTNGGAAARPFRTHLNALDQPMLLRIALELDLKRAMIGGVDRVYEIGRTFRNEGLDSTHAAEFSMLEAYQAYGDQFTMMQLTRDLVLNAAREVGRTVVPGRDGSEIDLEAEWRQAPILDLVSDALGEEITVETSVEALVAHAGKRDVELQPKWGAEEIVVELYEQLVEDSLITPTFVMDYPAAVKPLAKSHRSKNGLNEAWDLIINGVELAPAYSELNDPVVQRERLTAQSLLAAAGDPEAMELDEVFLRAMEYGMPPAGGMGMGVDRLIMLLTGAGIRETILFPLLRPE
ncbi:lysine--tRNA ligase [Nocardioides marmoriginsengisoli]|uniref:Lysine--tRNA ligase n=1 Tax=Nocardioides marmoriginsengisoli TaxID=661483 RepID=A0A3N0CG86_9ACTN|nr:lysine--tRNA ligase [Nocardioides marmoriginsengisoli]RNL62241.1 lysine--tRNA ligase [Nocardioides marmoriginsengisoli]